MKALLKIHGQNTMKYRQFPSGKEVVKVSENITLINELDRLEMIFTDDSGIVSDESGNEVYDPKYPDFADFHDYTYHVIDVDSLHVDDDYHLLQEIKKHI